MKRKRLKHRKLMVLLLLLIALLVAAAATALFLLRGGSGSDEIAYVQSVADITGQGEGALLTGRYSGIIEAKELIKVKLDADKKLGECLVKVGDRVEPGTPLFSYDVDSLMLTYEQLKLDYEGKKNNIETMQDQIKDLEKQIKKARSSTKAELTIQLQTTQLNLKKEEYEAKKKKLDLDDAQSVIRDNVVKAAHGGTVRSINPPTEEGQMQPTDGVETDTSYMTIVAGDDYRVKGTISEQGAYRLVQGTPVIIRSRVDETQTWRGTIDSVNTEQPIVNNQNMYYDNSSGEQASKYAFYVALESAVGLMMGQHVYIELDVGQEAEADALRLPAYYLIEENGRYYVYAASGRDRIEKRALTLGAYDEALDAYEILSGLTREDRIAFPDETVQPGMTAVDAGYAEGAPMDGGAMDGDMMDEAMMDGDMAAEPAPAG